MNNPTDNTIRTASVTTEVPATAQVQLADIEQRRRALDEQRQALEAQEAKLRAEVEAAIRQRVLGLPGYLGVANMEGVINLIRGAARANVAASAVATKRGGQKRIPEDIKEAIDRALKAGATIPSLHRYFKVSQPWLALRKRSLKLTHRKNAVRRDYQDILKEDRALAKAAA